MAGIYIHIPFCKQLCSYCDFYFSISLSAKDDMLRALMLELDQRKDYLAGEAADTLYFGGGTPTVYSPGEIQSLIDRTKELFGTESFREVTIEANPEDLTDEYLERLAGTDVSRLSIGIQSFHDHHLGFFNRRHNAQTAYDSVLAAKKHGFSNITIDLIYGIPGMTETEWRENLDKFMELDVPHLSAYHLTIEPRTVFGKKMQKGGFRQADEEVSELHFNMLREATGGTGYRHYEVSNFAKPGFEAIHNSNYWLGVPYLGIGPSAHSFDGRSRYWNFSSNRKYLENILSGTYGEKEELSERDLYNEFIMLSLRRADGIDYKTVKKRFGKEKLITLKEKIANFSRNGSIIDTDDRAFIPSYYFLRSDHIISELFEI